MSETKGKKSETRKRNITRSFRMDDEELAAFLANCETANLSGGDLFRVKCCGKKPLRAKRERRTQEKLLVKYLGQLGRYGNNLNQIAHALNIAKYKPDAAASLHILERHEETLREIRAIVDVSRDILTQTLLGHDT